MLAPLTTLNRAATRVHRSLHASLDAAGDLTDEALHNRPPPGDGDGDEAEESIEEMDPSDARGRIEEVYEPLMGGASRRSSRRSSVMLEEGDEVKVRKLEVSLSRCRARGRRWR